MICNKFLLFLCFAVLLCSISVSSDVYYLQPLANSTVSNIYIGIEKCNTLNTDNGAANYEFITAYPTSKYVLTNFTTSTDNYAVNNTLCWNNTLQYISSLSSIEIPSNCTTSCGDDACPCELGQQCNNTQTIDEFFNNIIIPTSYNFEEDETLTNDISNSTTNTCISSLECSSILNICIEEGSSDSFEISTLLISFDSYVSNTYELNTDVLNNITYFIEAQQFYCGFGHVIPVISTNSSMYVYLVNNQDAICDGNFWSTLQWELPIFNFSSHLPISLDVGFTSFAASNANSVSSDCFITGNICDENCNMKCPTGYECATDEDCASSTCIGNVCTLYLSASNIKIHFFIVILSLIVTIVTYFS